MDSALEIKRVSAADDDVRRLIGELDQFLSGEYSAEQRHGVALDALFQPHIRFFLAYKDGKAAGCAGVALFAGFAEAKRMYATKQLRGQGVADALLARLEQTTRAAGLTLLKPETGIHQPAALRFYERSGFTSCLAFRPCSSMPPSAITAGVFLEKELAAHA